MRELFIGCTRYAQGNFICKIGLSFVNAQNLRKILLLLPMGKICARFCFFCQCARYVKGSASFVNAQGLQKILLLLSDFRLLSDFTQPLLECNLRNRSSFSIMYPSSLILMQFFSSLSDFDHRTSKIFVLWFKM